MVTLGVVLGSVRPGRQAARVAKFVQNEFARNYPEVSISVIDPLEAKLPLLSNRYEFIKNSAECPPTLHTLHKQFTKCDGFVVVSPEYNHSIPPALTNTLDYFWQAEYSHKPVGIITYSMGQLAGFGAAVALLPWLNGLGMIAIPKMFSVAAIHNARE
ncbi:hypothetical protein HK100_000058 [Physocladia obscura]|uniref:NADPH-dependent FMN reductase-like domain-containing protein n=1 Tax=Physocladia obscura TaxID=109957 RepID=A0AAD5XFH3_9FUNG|nr:hypothetical protein HK100_000058 [Physocladia obscura]